MMKKEYETPDLEILLIDDSVVRTSPYGSDEDDDYGYW